MFKDYKLNISYENEGTLYASSNPKTGHYIIDIDDSNPDKLSFKINNSVRMENIKFTLEYDYNFEEGEIVYCNGYQSWTDSREFSKEDVMPPLSKWTEFTNFILHSNYQGDYTFSIYDKKPGFFHGWSYGYTRLGDRVRLMGSTRENTGFTVFYYDYRTNKIIIEKDLEGITLKDNSSYDLMDLFFAEGEYNEVFDKYFAELDLLYHSPRIRRKVGYTSWYNYYQNISDQIIYRDLESIAKLENKIDIFQIDDGFQTAVGDWFSINPKKFPDGMRKVSDAIHEKDMLAGLWLAPFGCQTSSKVAHEHKDWLIKDEKGYPINCGPNWGGFYSLDFYIPEVKEHIKELFATVLGKDDWNFDMVKLDFLYGVCIKPRHNKTRGQIMSDAVDLIRECCGDKLVLGCGVPLFPTFGKFDFCRTGCDVGLKWKKMNYFEIFSREGVSSMNSVINTIFRRHLNGRAFCNDPDVFILRADGGVTMNVKQQALLAKVNSTFGSLLFVSDNVSDYSEERKAIYEDTVRDDKIEIISAEQKNGIISISYKENDVQHDIKFVAETGEILEGEL